MAGKGLGSLTLDLILKLGGFEAGWDRAARITDKRAKQIEQSALNLGRGIGSALKRAVGGVLAFTGVSISAAAAVDSIKSAIDRADNIRDLSIRLGISTEKLSAFSYAASQTGTEIEELNKGFLRLSKNATAALDPKSRQANLFKILGINKEQLKDFDTLIPALADKFKALPDGITKSALALELFGRSGANLIEFMNQGSSGLSELENRAKQLGIVIDQDTADAADKFNDTLADLKAAAGGLATQVSSALLPQLQKLLDWAVEFVSDGDNAKEVADSVAEGFKGIVEAGRGVSDLIGIFGGLRTVLAGLENQAQALGNLDWFRYQEASAQIQAGLEGRTYNPKVGSMFQNVTGGVVTPPKPNFKGIYGGFVGTSEEIFNPTAALDKFFADPTPSGSKGAKKSGKSESEKEAERLLEAYERMSASLKEQAALQGEVSEVEKLRYELANGELAKLNDAQKQSLLTDAAALDQAREEYNLQQDGKALIESLLTPTEQINELRAEAAKLLEAGAIAQADYNKAIEAYKTPAEEVIAGLQEEIEMIGLTDLALQKLLATKQAGADATAEEIAQIEQLVELRAQAAAAADFQREIEYGLADAIYDVASGAKSAGDAVKDFFDDLAKYILRMIAENWAKQIAGLFTNTGGGGNAGTGTNWFAALAGALFGGGKASGGTAWPNSMYQVNERGFEMATVGGNDYMLTGSQPVKITPNHQLQGGGLVQNIQFNVQGRVSDETRSQAAAKVAYATQLVTARNGR